MNKIITGICLAFLLTHCSQAPVTDMETETDTTSTVVDRDTLMDKAGLVEELQKMGFSKEDAERMANEAEINKPDSASPVRDVINKNR